MKKKAPKLPTIEKRKKKSSYNERFEIALKDLRSNLRKENGVNMKKYLKIIYIFDFCKDELIPSRSHRMSDKKWQKVEDIFMLLIKGLSKSKSNKEKTVIDRRIKHVWLSCIKYALDERYSTKGFWAELVDLGIGCFFEQLKLDTDRLDKDKTSSSPNLLDTIRGSGKCLRKAEIGTSDLKTAFVSIGIESKDGKVYLYGVSRTRRLIKKVLLEIRKEQKYLDLE